MGAAEVLIDTGAILALLDERDRWHVPCRNAIRQLRFPLLTSEAVLTEALHLIQRSRTQMEAVWALLESGAISMATIENMELSQISGLMARYKDRPMDFADATLAYLAERESIQTMLTVDQKDFAGYRIGPKKAFHLLPVERP